MSEEEEERNPKYLDGCEYTLDDYFVNKKELKLAKEALDLHCAVALSVVVIIFRNVLSSLSKISSENVSEGLTQSGGDEWVYRHPVSVAFGKIISHLTTSNAKFDVNNDEDFDELFFALEDAGIDINEPYPEEPDNDK